MVREIAKTGYHYTIGLIIVKENWPSDTRLCRSGAPWDAALNPWCS
jgi:hypothetical protein